MKRVKFTYILPAYNEEACLRDSVDRLRTFLKKFPGSRILIVENGSTDSTWKVALSLERNTNDVSVEAFQSPKKGLGAAFRLGVEKALNGSESWVIFEDADLPFGTSDVESFLRLGKPLVAAGSKLHPKSRVARSRKREVMTFLYYQCRKRLLRTSVKDCQGSLLVHSDLLRKVRHRLRSTDYFYTTELIHYLERAGFTVQELPVTYEGEKRTSSVKTFRHSAKLLLQTIELSWSYKE